MDRTYADPGRVDAPGPHDQQQNDALEVAHSITQTPGAVQGQNNPGNTFNDFLTSLSEEERDIFFLDVDQQLAASGATLEPPKETDGVTSAIPGAANSSSGDAAYQALDECFPSAINQDSQGYHRLSLQQAPEPSNQATQMNSTDFVAAPGLAAGPLYNRPSVNSFKQNSNAVALTGCHAQMHLFSTDVPDIRKLEGQNDTAGYPILNVGEYAQPSTLTDSPSRKGLRPQPASEPRKTTTHAVRRQKPSMSEFWRSFTTIIHPTLRIRCRGTFGELLERYPELEPTITMQGVKWRRGTSGTRWKATSHRKNASQAPSQHAAPAIERADYGRSMAPGAGVQENTISPIQIPENGAAQSPSALNMSGLQVQSPVAFSPLVSASTTIAPQMAFGDGGAEAFDLEHQSIDATLEFIERPPAEVCERLNVEGDDWEFLSDFSTEFRSLCQELFEALQHPGGDVPDHFDDEQTRNYTKNHEKVYALVLESMRSAEQISEAKARVIKAMHEVVRVHEVGIPKTVLQMKTKARGYEIDKESTCRQRAQKVINNTKACKYIAVDILKSKNLADFARAPDLYLGKKYGNSKGNKNRGDDLKDMRALKKGQKTPGEVLGGRFQPDASAYGYMISEASTPAPDGFSQQYKSFGPDTGTPQSSIYLTPQSHVVHSPGHQREYFPVRYSLQTGDSGTMNGRKRGVDDREDKEDVGNADRYGKRARMHYSRRQY